MHHSSILPKLLAKENITIQHGNYHTAWFDVKDRVLGLPLWKDMGKDVYDLLVGHEVSHALHTPFEGWHDSPEKLEGAPRSYLNVCEDARIERFIQNIYPGLVGPMARGYKVLKAEGFFGDVDSMDWKDIKLIDKINIKTKLGHLAEVPFTPEEEVFLKRSLTTETFDEVVQLAKDILAFTKENQPELLQPQGEPPKDTPQVNEDQEDLPQGHDDMESAPGEESKSEDEKAEDKAFKEDMEGDSDDEEEASLEDDGENLFDKEGDTENTELSNQPEYQEDVSMTDECHRRSEEKLLDKDEDGNQKTFINKLRKDHLEAAVIDYKTLQEERKEYGRNADAEKYAGFKAYLKESKKAVNFAVKEFEQRKAAFQYTRATTAKTGRLDVNKLWSYKTSEDIFSQVTRLADAKNHGMIFLIDYSGSMHQSMPYVMDQVLHLVLFCKAVNIPFDVYGFTSTNPRFKRSYDDKPNTLRLHNDGDMHIDGLSMPLVCSSSLKKKDFEDSLRHMYGRKNSNQYWHYETLCPYEEYGSTPLNQALIVSHYLIKAFKAKHQVQKMNFVAFTDGESNGLSVIQSNKMEDKKLDTTNYYNGGYKILIDGKICETKSRYNSTKALLQNIRKRYNTKTIGFFMADNNQHWRDRIWRLKDEVSFEDDNIYLDEFKKECAAEYRKNKCVSKQNVFGYDQYYLLKGGKTLKAENEDFETFGTESDSQLRSAFKKHSKGKKLNKVLMTSFGKEVA